MSHVALMFGNLIVIVAFWSLVWKRYQICRFRDRLIEIRGNLFDIAIKNPEFGFTNSLYLQFESILNGTARYAYRIGFMDFLYFLLFVRTEYKKGNPTNRFEDNFRKTLSSIKDKHTKQTLVRAKIKYEQAVFQFVIFSSMTLSIVFNCAVIYWAIREIVCSTAKSCVLLFKGLSIEFHPKIKGLEREVATTLRKNFRAHEIITEMEATAELAQCTP